MADTKDLKEYGSKRGVFRAVPVQMFDGTWRTQIITGHKFTDREKEIFLNEYSKHGRKGAAARIAGVSTKTISDHVSKDPHFAMACLEAENNYRERLVEHVQNLVFEGTEKISYDRTGNIVSREQIYPIPLILAEMKKVDDGYRDKKEVTMNVNGGVLVAPSNMESIEDWEKKFGSSGPKIEGQIVTDSLTESVSDEDDENDGESPAEEIEAENE